MPIRPHRIVPFGLALVCGCAGHVGAATVPDVGLTDANVADAGGPFDADPPFRFFHNRTVDARVATTAVVPDTDLPATLAGYLDRATRTVDVAAYQFSDPQLADALVRAAGRGVRVRLVIDADNVAAAQPYLDQLASVGIAHLDDSANGQPSSALMHDKFVVLDGQVVWTGSYNLTPNGADDDRQDVVVVHDAALAAAYTAQFEQMWGSSGATPDPASAAFHNRKQDLGAHVFDVSGRTVEVWFSPRDDAAAGGPMKHLISVVDGADVSIDFHIFVFSEQALADAMHARFALGVGVRGVFEDNYWNVGYSESMDLRGLAVTDPLDSFPWSPPADVYPLREVQFLHAKSMVVDASASGSSPTVALGSFNWTASANDANDENLLIVRDDPVLANQLLQAVCGSVLAAGGSCVP